MSWNDLRILDFHEEEKCGLGSSDLPCLPFLPPPLLLLWDLDADESFDGKVSRT